MSRSSVNYWHCPPKSLRKPHVKLDNITLIPASELHSLGKWQKRAQQLPSGDTLLVLPGNNPQLQDVGQRISLSLKRRGRHSTIATIR